MHYFAIGVCVGLGIGVHIYVIVSSEHLMDLVNILYGNRGCCCVVVLRPQ